MLFGISGASGTGKTTLAKRIAEELGITYMPTSITECARKHGFTAVSSLSMRDRLTLQMKLLEDHVTMITEAQRPLIVDRTPVDMIAYMMCEVEMMSHTRMTPEVTTAVDEYVTLCLETTAKLYDSIFVLEQLDHYEIKATRPPENRAYQTHTSLVMVGALNRLGGRVNCTLVRQADLNLRTEYVSDFIVGRMDEISRERATSAHIH